MFADRAKIYVRSGKGGDGHVSFRREKYVPSGGPDGGDGGHGGDVIFVVDEGLNTLIDFRHIRKYKAGDGEEGGKKNCRGKDGEDIIIKVPAGTVIKEAQSGQVITDMSGDNKRVVLLKGGKGGNGNQHYATSTMQAPKYAQPGQAAQELELLLELKVIADVGLVGFPNVGKSTFLSRVTNARPKIANYHFTTLNPNLDGSDPVAAIRAEFEPKGIKVFPMSAVTGQGIKELLYEVNDMLANIGEETTVFAQEYFPESMTGSVDDAYTVTYDEEEDEYVVEGPKIEKMLGYTNLDSEKGFTFFQNFLKDTGILEELEALGIQEGDTVRMYGLSFDYYK